MRTSKDERTVPLFLQTITRLLIKFCEPFTFLIIPKCSKRIESALNTNEKSVEDQWIYLKANLLKAT